MKILSQDYKEAKMIALANNFVDEFPDYFMNLAVDKVVEQKFLETNYA